MPIDFRCPQCGKLLRTPDNSAGKQAKCPQCAAILRVPDVGAATPADSGAGAGGAGSGDAGEERPFSSFDRGPSAPGQGSDAGYQMASGGGGGAGGFGGGGGNLGGDSVGGGYGAASDNPFSAPQTDSYQARVVGDGEFAPTKIELGTLLSKSWEITKQNLLKVLGMFAVLFAVAVCFQLFVGGVLGAAGDSAVGAIIVLVTLVAFMAFELVISAGVSIFMLKVARGQSTTFSDLFTGTRFIVPILVSSIVVGICVLLGFVALIVPGIIIALMLWPFIFIIVDRNAGAMESLTIARQITDGNKLTIFLLHIVFSALSLACILTLGLGYFVLIPYQMVAFAVAYLMMSGQRTAAD
ncbi:MAG: DUF975 family protein [Planctomycetota bacterium]|nr:DUF975 family protein [Planctomycetota bacterium]